MDNETARRISGELTAAIEAKDSEQFQRILQEHPEFPPAEHWLAPVHSSAVKSGLQTFKAFVEHFPQSKDWDLGHLGNPVGLAAMEGDVSYLKFLLEELGLKANEGRIMYTPALYFISQLDESKFKPKSQIIQILERWGATLEGEGICYQKSHTLPDGTLCWHRGGGPKPPTCLASI